MNKVSNINPSQFNCCLKLCAGLKKIIRYATSYVQKI